MVKRRISGHVLHAAVAGIGGLWLCEVAGAFEPSVNYMLQCMGCHTPDGSGAAGRVPSIRSTLLPFSGVTAGRQFLVQVPGVSQSTLSDVELADLLNWMIENLSSEPRGVVFKRFTAAEVAGYRRKPLVEVRATREHLLNATGIEEMMQSAKKQ
jgi:hypothetical protein